MKKISMKNIGVKVIIPNQTTTKKKKQAIKNMSNQNIHSVILELSVFCVHFFEDFAVYLSRLTIGWLRGGGVKLENI